MDDAKKAQIEQLLAADRKLDATIKDLQEKKKTINKAILSLMGTERTLTAGWCGLYISSRQTYKLLPTVDIATIARSYPMTITVDAKKLYEVAENPTNFIEVKNGEPFLTIREKKEKAE